MEIKQGSYNEEYLYFDPKILRGQDNIPRAKNPFQVEWFFKNVIIIIINFNCYIDDGLISPPLVHTMGQKIFKKSWNEINVINFWLLLGAKNSIYNCTLQWSAVMNCKFKRCLYILPELQGTTISKFSKESSWTTTHVMNFNHPSLCCFDYLTSQNF